MADPEVSTIATKAPESDAAEDVQKDTPPSLVAGDTPAQTGASLGVSNGLLRCPVVDGLLILDRSTV